jgi:hypothetical protein
MNIGSSLVSHPQAAELVQPAQGALYHPPGYTQATTMRRSLLAQHR